MKKLLNLLAVTSLISSISATTVACGKGRLSTTITYGIVDNGVDNISQSDWQELEEKYYSLYGNKYTLKAYKEVGDSELPEKILNVGAQSFPDVYTASVDMVSKLATNNAILALDGKDAPPFMQKILADLNYNVEYATSILKKPIKDRTTQEEWGTFLPYAIESSNMVNNNQLSQNEGKRAQYGITRGLGVGGGSSIVRKEHNSTLNDIGFEYVKDEKGKDTKNLNPEGNTTLRRMSNYSAKMETKNEQESKPNQIIPMLIDRGMWEMYPFYSNIISDEIESKIYKASKIGVNWINDPSLPYHNPNEKKYSTVFSNPYFRDSAVEIMEAFFDYWAQLYKVALNKFPENGNAYETAKNLFDPTGGLNGKVKNNMVKNGFAVTTTSEPSNYTSFIGAAQSFKNMEFVDMNSIKIFDSNLESDKAQKYEKLGLNKWMTPAGSSMFVFSRNLGKDKEKAIASMKFVELALGFQEDENGKVSSDGVGGMFNLEKGFLNSSILPSRIAINNEKWTNDENFMKGIREKKVPRRKEATIKSYPPYQKEYNKDPKGEIEALVGLEKYAIGLASRMYDTEKTELSLAPNVSAYDPAGVGDLHGINAMRPNLERAFDLSKKEFQNIYGNFNSPINYKSNNFINARKAFIDAFLAEMSKINSQK